MNVIFILSLLVVGLAGLQQYHGPRCFGPYCIDQNVPVSKVLKELGPVPRISPMESYCYRSEDGSLFAYVEGDEQDPPDVDAIFISDFPNCFHAPVRVSKADLRTWTTREGIGIGTPVDEVRKKYGTPAAVRKIDANALKLIPKLILKNYRGGEQLKQIGDEELTYAAGSDVGDLSDAEFGIRNGKVSYLLLANRE